jgi:hypothetical protein
MPIFDVQSSRKQAGTERCEKGQQREQKKSESTRSLVAMSRVQCLQALEWALRNLDILSRLQPLIDLQKFIFAQAGF